MLLPSSGAAAKVNKQGGGGRSETKERSPSQPEYLTETGFIGGDNEACLHRGLG